MPERFVPVIVPVAATLVGVIAPSVNDMAGVVVEFKTVPLTPLAVVTETSFTVPPPPPAGAANVPSPLKNVVVLFGGVGTAPPTVAVIVGRSEFSAMLGTPVPVVFFNRPVPKPDSKVLLILVTVDAAVTFVVPLKLGDVYVTSPVKAMVLPVASAVAVLALPVMVVWSPVFMPDKLDTAPFASMALVIVALALEVTFPIEVTGPVKFALVVTVAALPVMFV